MSANIHHANQKMMSLTANSSDHVLMTGTRPGIARFASIKQNLIHKPAARPIADAVRERADERGMSLSDYIASVLAREVGMSDLAPESVVHHQEELPISQVA